MQIIRKITNELTIAGQLSLDQLKQIAQAGFKSVLNLRSPQEIGFNNSEQQQAELLGLFYLNIPIKIELINDSIITELNNKINNLPKPIVIHCDNALRAASIVLIYIYMRQGATVETALNQIVELGLFNQTARQ